MLGSHSFLSRPPLLAPPSTSQSFQGPGTGPCSQVQYRKGLCPSSAYRDWWRGRGGVPASPCNGAAPRALLHTHPGLRQKKGWTGHPGPIPHPDRASLTTFPARDSVEALRDHCGLPTLGIIQCRHWSFDLGCLLPLNTDSGARLDQGP